MDTQEHLNQLRAISDLITAALADGTVTGFEHEKLSSIWSKLKITHGNAEFTISVKQNPVRS